MFFSYIEISLSCFQGDLSSLSSLRDGRAKSYCTLARWPRQVLLRSGAMAAPSLIALWRDGRAKSYCALARRPRQTQLNTISTVLIDFVRTSNRQTVPC